MASKALFVTTEDLAKFTALNGNIDPDKFVQFVKVAQDIHIQTYLGTDLFNKITTDVIAGTLAGAYLTLVNNYVKDMVFQWALVEYLPWAAYTIANKGVYKHTTENGETVDQSEVKYLVEKARDTAEHYTKRFVDYMCFNSSTFTEYTSNTNADMNPEKGNYYGGWVL